MPFDLDFDTISNFDDIIDVDLLAGAYQLDGSVVPLPPYGRRAAVL